MNASFATTASFTPTTALEMRNVLIYAAVIIAVGVILILILRKASPAIASGTMAMVLPSEARSASGYAGPAVHGFVLLND